MPLKEFSSGTGWPASKQSKLAMGPMTWSYFVTTTPFSMRLPITSDAALAICQAALPAATSSTRPGKVICFRARCTAASGCTAAMASLTIRSAWERKSLSIGYLLYFCPFFFSVKRKRGTKKKS